MIPDLEEFLIPIPSGMAPVGIVGVVAPTTASGRLSRERLARLLADLDALASHRVRAARQLRNGDADAR